MSSLAANHAWIYLSTESLGQNSPLDAADGPAGNEGGERSSRVAVGGMLGAGGLL